jgi:UrcA family protein
MDRVYMNEAAKSIDTEPPWPANEVPTAQSDFSIPQEIPMTTSLSLRGVLATAIFGALTFSLAIVSTAAETYPTRTVKFSDLNVSNPQGAAALYARIQLAAHQVCLPLDGRDLGSKGRMDACVHKAIADAVAKVGQPALFDAYNARHGQSTRIVLAASR